MFLVILGYYEVLNTGSELLVFFCHLLLHFFSLLHSKSKGDNS